jgi:hypothetical protein
VRYRPKSLRTGYSGTGGCKIVAICWSGDLSKDALEHVGVHRPQRLRTNIAEGGCIQQRCGHSLIIAFGDHDEIVTAKAAAIAASGLTPLDYLLSVLRDETASRAERMEAASKAAPYVHPRLAAVEYTASTISVQQPFDLSRMGAMRESW